MVYSNLKVISAEKDQDFKLIPVNETVKRDFEVRPLDIFHYTYKEVYLSIDQFAKSSYLLCDGQVSAGLGWQSPCVCMHGFEYLYGMITVFSSNDTISRLRPSNSQCLRTSAVK